MSCLPQLLELYSNLILSLEDDDNSDPLWQRFYQIQMASFILGSQSMDFCLKNALRAYSLISEKWDELEEDLDNSPFSVQNYDNIFKQVFIDFGN